MKVKIGMIGIGDILTSHLEALKANPEFELVAVCRRSEERLRQQARQLGCEGFTDYHDLLARRPDAVLVSLPHGMHCEATVEALKAGCHVLVEKPMAVTVGECRTMLRTAGECDRQLIVTESASFTPGAMRTGEKFRAGQLGRFFTGSILNFRFYFNLDRPAWFLDPAMSGGGMFANIGLHRLATARACLPGLDPARVSGTVGRVAEHSVEACTGAIVHYRQGGAMIYEEIGYYPKPAWINAGTHLVFEEGIVAWDQTTWRMMTRQGQEYQELLPPAANLYAPCYANLLRAIRGESYGPKAWEYAVDTAIAQAVYSSARDGMEIDLNEPDWMIPREE